MRYTVNQQLHVKVLALPEVSCYIFFALSGNGFHLRPNTCLAAPKEEKDNRYDHICIDQINFVFDGRNGTLVTPSNYSILCAQESHHRKRFQIIPVELALAL